MHYNTINAILAKLSTLQLEVELARRDIHSVIIRAQGNCESVLKQIDKMKDMIKQERSS